jgi:hypothetical protein
MMSMRKLISNGSGAYVKATEGQLAILFKVEA